MGAEDFMKRKILPFTVILLLIGFNVTGSYIQDTKDVSTVNFDGNILYVGGSGPNNYTTIQSAIDNSSNGDAVFVYSGTYVENVQINKSISLTGEDKNLTSIQGSYINDVVNVSADYIIIQNFTIVQSGGPPSWYNAGIQINSNDNHIINCNICFNYVGIYINKFCSNNSIINNHIHNNELDGITTRYKGNHIIISNNIINNNLYCGMNLGQNNNITVCNNHIYNHSIVGISGWELENSIITKNNVEKNKYALSFGRSYNNIITENILIDNELWGIELHSESADNIIFHNVFMNNSRQNAYVWENPGNNTWDDGYPSGGNYWDDYNGTDIDGDGIGDTPYIIGGDNQDRYPLMEPWRNKIPLVEIINPKEGYLHFFGIPLFPTLLNLISDTKSIGGFRFRPIIINATDDNFNRTDLIVKVYLNDELQGNASYCCDWKLHEWFWSGQAFGKYNLTITAEDPLGAIGTAEMSIFNIRTFP